MTDLTDAELEALGRCADAACEFADALPSHTSLTTPSCLAQAWMHFQRLAKAYRAGYDAAVKAEREARKADESAWSESCQHLTEDLERWYAVARHYDVPKWDGKMYSSIEEWFDRIAAAIRARGTP